MHIIVHTQMWQDNGEFIITVPYAYHSGYNTGYNWAEALTLCPYGKYCTMVTEILFYFFGEFFWTSE